MEFNNRIYGIYVAHGQIFDRLVDELLEICRSKRGIIRLVFFGKPEDNGVYLQQLTTIYQKVVMIFGEERPAVSYVAQSPLVGDLVMEVHQLEADFKGTIRYKTVGDTYYVQLDDNQCRELVLGGLRADFPEEPVGGQAKHIFKEVAKVLDAERCPVYAIVRQWNYIERITHFDGERQYYQDFNDARSHFYSGTEWLDGYPAATGIGTQQGGVMVDLNVIIPKRDEVRCVALNNKWQVAAHDYSQHVLKGVNDREYDRKTTPKFERAKALVSDQGGLVYISGTAAIRGEQSVEEKGVLEQTRITMENIYALISVEQLNQMKIFPEKECHIEMLRVYLKRPEDIAVVKTYMENKFARIPVSYLLADVCRDELLVEIEGIASFVVTSPEEN